MTSSECSAEEVRKHLERVLASPGFARNERLSRFLRVIVERHLEGRDGDLKESVLGIEVFGRQPGFDAKQDSTVRTEAGRLRARLAEYYAGDGIGDRVVIELPKGGYIPAFRPSGAVGKDKAWYRRPWILASAVLAVVAVAAGWWWVQHKRAPITIAVLPLTDLSPDPSNAYFADGLTDEIIRDLSIIDGLAVRSHTSSFAFKGKPRNVREAGEQLQAEYILEGSVLRTGQKLRIIAQLVRAHDDFPLWSGRFDRELTDVVAIQDDISRGIVNSLRLKLGRGRRRYETSVEAYDLYLRDRSLILPIGQLSPGVRRHNPIPFQDVIAKDSGFAPAYAGLAEAYSTLASIAGAEPDNLVKMREMAERAIQLDPLLEEAHDALGVVYARDGQWSRAETSFRRAIELNPNSELTRLNYVTSLLWPLGRIDEAIQQLRAAEKSDPLSPMLQYVYGDVLISASRYKEASAHCAKSSDMAECQGRVFLADGRIDDAIKLLASAPNTRYLGYAYGRAGRRREVEELAVVSPGALQQVLIYAGLGDRDGTINALQRIFELGPVRVGLTLSLPELSFIREDPRVKALRGKAGLPE
jgi:TolB-like protein